MLKKAEKNIFISATQKEFVGLVENFRLLFEKLNKKNIKIIISTQINSTIKKHVEDSRKFAEIKHTDNKARFCIVDSTEMLFMITDDNEVHPTYDVGVWVNTPLAKDLKNFS